MAFVIPTMHLKCKVWRGNLPPGLAEPVFEVECQLRAPNPSIQVTVPSAGWLTPMLLLVPPKTDIRDPWAGDPLTTSSADYVECPSDTGRIYRVAMVDDIALGFDNEHRYCVLYKTTTHPWPVPIP